MPAKKAAKKSAPKKVTKKVTPKEIPIKSTAVNTKKTSASWMSAERFTIYIYWFIILFFVAATFYIIGRSQEFMKQAPVADNVEIVDIATPGIGDVNAYDYLVVGKSKLLSNDIQGAIYDLSISISADPTIADAYIYRGEAYMQISDNASAINDFDIAISLAPDNAVAYYDRAILQARAENYPAAFADINNAIVAQESGANNNILTMADIYSKRAQFNIWSKNWGAAISDYTTAIDLGSVDASDYAARAEAETALGQYDAAAEDYLQAVKLISEQIHAAPSAGEREMMSRMAVTYFEKSAALRIQMSDFEGAKSDLQSAITISGALGDTEQVERLLTLEQSI